MKLKSVFTTLFLVLSVFFGTLSSEAQAAVSVYVPPSTNQTFKVKVRWDPPLVGETNLSGYKIYYGTNTGIYTTAVPVNTNGYAGTTVSNLVAGTNVTFYLMVTATNLAGLESLPSNEVTFVPPVPPAVPRNFKLTLVELMQQLSALLTGP
jgi:hypothetical protein